jgi:cytochrome c oxidase subunit 2
VNPHAVKPWVRMPANPLPPDELNALLAYLETLR